MYISQREKQTMTDRVYKSLQPIVFVMVVVGTISGLGLLVVH